MAEDKVLVTIAGNVGQAPEQRTTNSGKEVVNFSVAQAVKFGKDAPAPDWYNVAVWDEAMRKLVLRTIKKGARVTVIGPVNERNVGGKTYRDIQGYRIGLTEYLFPLDKAPGQPQGPRQAPDTDDDELPF